MNEKEAREIIEHNNRFELISDDNDARSKWFKRSYGLIGKLKLWQHSVLKAEGYLEGLKERDEQLKVLSEERVKVLKAAEDMEYRLTGQLRVAVKALNKIGYGKNVSGCWHCEEGYDDGPKHYSKCGYRLAKSALEKIKAMKDKRWIIYQSHVVEQHDSKGK